MSISSLLDSNSINKIALTQYLSLWNIGHPGKHTSQNVVTYTKSIQLSILKSFIKTIFM
jgi:hypothetical protein